MLRLHHLQGALLLSDVLRTRRQTLLRPALPPAERQPVRRLRQWHRGAVPRGRERQETSPGLLPVRGLPRGAEGRLLRGQRTRVLREGRVAPRAAAVDDRAEGLDADDGFAPRATSGPRRAKKWELRRAEHQQDGTWGLRAPAQDGEADHQAGDDVNPAPTAVEHRSCRPLMLIPFTFDSD